LSSSGAVPDVIPPPTGNLASQLATDLTDTFLALDPGNRDLDADLSDAFFRIDMGWAENASVATLGDTTVPVSGGTAVIGIFDDHTVEGGERGGPKWWCKESDGYVIGLYITIGARGTYRIEAIQPRDDGLLLECLLEFIS